MSGAVFHGNDWLAAVRRAKEISGTAVYAPSLGGWGFWSSTNRIAWSELLPCAGSGVVWEAGMQGARLPPRDGWGPPASPEGAPARGAEPPAQAPPPAGPACPPPAAEIGPQAGGQGPEIVVREVFGGWRFSSVPEADPNPDIPDWSLPYATEGAARAGAREAEAAAFRLRAAEAKAAELAAEVERLACLLVEVGDTAEARWVKGTCRKVSSSAQALLARLGFRPGQP